MNQIGPARENFQKVQKIQKEILVKQLKDKGQVFESNIDEISVQKLTEPSIFDDEQIKVLKATLIDV